ncbi:MAG TPA: hypothetical protein VK530_18975, partial [Candidatus Acidoferrum sp.]|nr:hypothetical protein [Candidatus Acidoferrum sp.]
MALIIGAACPAFAQGTRRVVEEPRWLKYDLREVSSGVYAEGIYDETSFPGSATTFSHEREFVGPLLGASAAGSVYHPNLIRFQTDLDGALGYSLDTVKGAGRSTTREEFQFLGRFNGTATILANRPYNGGVYGTYDHSYRDYDFFNRVTVDSSQYGARANYSRTNYFVTAYYTHRDETADGLRTRTITSDDVIGLNARHDRVSGNSTLNYTYNRYDRSDVGRIGNGNDHTITLSDAENFGTRHRAALNSSLTYSHRNTTEEIIDQVTANSALAIEHPRNLWSYYDATFDHYENDDFQSDAVIGSAQVRHQLFSSLASSLTLNGADYEVSDAISEGYTRRVGLAWGEAYTKKVSLTGRLNIANTLAVDHVDQATISTIENERHRFDENGGSFFLIMTDIDPLSIVITDIADTRPAFVPGIDYVVTQVGSRTLITQPAGSRIGLSQVVLIDYRVERLTSGAYESLTDTFTVRF